MPERYREEIEELLRQIGEQSPPRRSRRSFKATIGAHLAKALGGRSWSLKPGRLMLIAVGLVIAGLVVKPLVGLVWAGIILFIVAYALFFIRPSAPEEKRWRGRVVEYRTTWRHRFRRWFGL